MNKKYLLIGGIAIFVAWWFFFRNTETEEADTADDQPEEEEENTTANVIISTSLRGGRTTAGLTQPNKSGSGKGTTNNRRSGEAAITYEPTYQHFEGKIYTPNN